ncbi:MAG: YqaA family protein [Candidatus Saccharimonadaceae bacterium]
MDGFVEWGFFGLFMASFLAATILPFGSEVVFAALIAAGFDLWTSIIIATIGNSLGGMTCYWFGSFGRIEWIERFMRIKRERVQKMQDWLKGKGAMMSFFVFLPGVGDIIAVALGFMRANPWLVLLFMTLGKFGRYVVVGFGLEQILKWF